MSLTVSICAQLQFLPGRQYVTVDNSLKQPAVGVRRWWRMKGPEKVEEEMNCDGGGRREAQTFRPNIQQWNDLPR